MEKTPKHKMAEVSKFRKSQKRETSTDLFFFFQCSPDGDLDVLQVGISNNASSLTFSLFFLFFKEVVCVSFPGASPPSDCSLDRRASGLPFSGGSWLSSL